MATELLFKNEFQQPGGRPESESRIGTREDAGGVLICAMCLNAITTSSARTERAGSHSHTFSNPHGFVFHIACFSTAPGCDTGSDPTAEYSWFPGFSWQVAVCRGCGEHLGWLFSGAESRFHGLIVDRLAETDGAGSAH